MRSLSNELNRQRVFKAGQGAGKSGSFFFFTHDNKFVIKTVKDQERQKLISILDNLIEHFTNTENESLLARIYGLFSIHSNIFGPLSVILMQNTARIKDK